MEIEGGKIIFGYMAMKLYGKWNSQTVFHHNRCVSDDKGNWWVSKKSSQEAPNVNHPLPGFDEDGNPVESEWWALWIDWQHPMARVMAAVQAAIDAASNADAKAREAEEAAARANNADLSDHENRIAELEQSLQSLTEDDIAQMRSSIESLEALVGADVDGVINKFNELVAFMAGISDTSTLAGLLQEIASQLAQKQDSGDYATNQRVDELESKVGAYCSPRFVGKTLVFPAENAAHFEGKKLVLTQ